MTHHILCARHLSVLAADPKNHSSLTHFKRLKTVFVSPTFHRTRSLIHVLNAALAAIILAIVPLRVPPRDSKNCTASRGRLTQIFRTTSFSVFRFTWRPKKIAIDKSESTMKNPDRLVRLPVLDSIRQLVRTTETLPTLYGIGSSFSSNGYGGCTPVCSKK